MTDELFTPTAFDDFYFAVHGRRPFAWQTRLARHVIRRPSKKDGQGAWPLALDIPTGAGKTSALDVAVFHLAREAARAAASPAGERRAAALRIFFVVDRRLVVDDAFRHARKLARKLADADAGSGVLAAAARSLRSLAEFGTGDAAPLTVTRLRGGAPKDPDWVRSPCQPAIIISTVDQVGSRLLFRGYGVSDRMKPVHAALVGTDALFLLDEAHLSNPFVGTLRAVADQRRAPTPFHVVTLSATQRAAVREFIEDKDLEDVSPGSLGLRLRCAKRARLVLVKEKKDAADNAVHFAEELVRATRQHLEDPNAHAIAVVVNRVRRARLVFEGLSRDLRERSLPVDVILLTGRTRPLDRDEVLARYRKRIATDPSRSVPTRRLVVVATQCIEAGADLDFDALITELAPLDALRQRFGRLHRLGRQLDAPAVGFLPASIVAYGDQVGARAKADPIYGDALRNTWDLLSQKAKKPAKVKKTSAGDEPPSDEASIIDFGVQASRAWLPRGDDLAPYLAPAGSAEGPIVVPAFVAQWSRTSPVPAVDADVSLFLHGRQSGPGDVQIVWRADLDEREPPQDWVERVAACPPSSLEALQVPLFEARRWLTNAARAEIGDIEGAGDEERGERRDRLARRALRWRGRDDARPVHRPTDLAAGDTLVVPATYGGADRWGWLPVEVERGAAERELKKLHRRRAAKPTPLIDLGEDANKLHRGRDILRLSPALLELARRGELAEDDPRKADKKASEDRRAFERLLARKTEDGDAAIAALTRDEMKDLLLDFDGLPERWRDWLARDEAFHIHWNKRGVPLALERKLSLEDVRKHTSARYTSVDEASPHGETWRAGVDDALGSEGTDGDLGGEATTEDDESSHLESSGGRARRRPVLLSRHSKGVRDIAKTMAVRAGLSEARAEDIALAGFLHDAGKAHPDFQALLFGGDEIAAELARERGNALAKSGRLKLDRAARERANLPVGARHEVASLWLALAHPALANAHDRDFVLWLIGTHHGHGRPFFPAIEWPRPGETLVASLDDGPPVASQPAASLAVLMSRWTMLHERLSRELDAWELAYCEAIVRLADHRASEGEQRTDAPTDSSPKRAAHRARRDAAVHPMKEERP